MGRQRFVTLSAWLSKLPKIGLWCRKQFCLPTRYVRESSTVRVRCPKLHMRCAMLTVLGLCLVFCLTLRAEARVFQTDFVLAADGKGDFYIVTQKFAFDLGLKQQVTAIADNE